MKNVENNSLKKMNNYQKAKKTSDISFLVIFPYNRPI